MKRVIAGLAAVAAIVLAPAAADAQDSATITLLHGIPGATVDVAVGGEVVVPGFEPGDTQDLSAFAGQTLANLEVRAAGTEDVVIGPVAEFAVPASGNWTVVAHLDADGNPTITPFENDTSTPATGSGRLTVRHLAAAPAVDLVVGDARPIENAANGDEASLELPEGDVAGAQLAPTGGDPIVDVPTVTITSGVNLIVYAVGSLEGETFTFLTQEVATDGVADAAAPTAVNTGDAIDDGTNMALIAAAGAMTLVAGGAMVLRRRSINA
jgi:Domain of unknown function (DUF4397)